MSAQHNETVLQKVAEIAERVGQPAGLEIVDIELLGGGKARLLRIYIDKPEGVTHGDCELISQRVGEALDAEDVIPGSAGYTLEVSSPGVERKLSKPQHFERFLGHNARITLRRPLENRRRWEGRMTAFENGVLTLEPPSGEPVRFGLEEIEKANLKFDW